jgi:hypothetical protein
MRRYPTLSGGEGCSVVFFFKVKKTKLKSQASGDRPHKNFVSFQREGSQKDDPIFQGLSDTEARAGQCAGAACIATGIRTVENKKFL